MSNIVWQCPVPSSGFLRGVALQSRPQREVALTFDYEDGEGLMQSGELSFNDVVHYRVTYLAALKANVIREAYDQLVELHDSQELLETVEATFANGRGSGFSHYRICFDDGPCFDLICRSFSSQVK